MGHRETRGDGRKVELFGVTGQAEVIREGEGRGQEEGLTEEDMRGRQLRAEDSEGDEAAEGGD